MRIRRAMNSTPTIIGQASVMDGPLAAQVEAS
jgi:hypothetical protein